MPRDATCPVACSSKCSSLDGQSQLRCHILHTLVTLAASARKRIPGTPILLCLLRCSAVSPVFVVEMQQLGALRFIAGAHAWNKILKHNPHDFATIELQLFGVAQKRYSQSCTEARGHMGRVSRLDNPGSGTDQSELLPLSTLLGCCWQIEVVWGCVVV